MLAVGTVLHHEAGEEVGGGNLISQSVPDRIRFEGRGGLGVRRIRSCSRSSMLIHHPLLIQAIHVRRDRGTGASAATDAAVLMMLRVTD